MNISLSIIPYGRFCRKCTDRSEKTFIVVGAVHVMGEGDILDILI